MCRAEVIFKQAGARVAGGRLGAAGLRGTQAGQRPESGGPKGLCCRAEPSAAEVACPQPTGATHQMRNQQSSTSSRRRAKQPHLREAAGVHGRQLFSWELCSMPLHHRCHT